MKPRVLIIGFLAISLVFSLGLIYILKKTSLDPAKFKPDTTVFNVPTGQLSPEAIEAGRAETFSQSILLRGFIIDYQAQKNLLLVGHQSRDYLGNKQAAPVEVDLSQIADVLCWPETVTSNTGSTISISTAYFPMSEDSYMFLKGEQKLKLEQALPYITPNRFSFVLLEKPITNNSTKPTAKQLVLLGCN